MFPWDWGFQLGLYLVFNCTHLRSISPKALSKSLGWCNGDRNECSLLTRTKVPDSKTKEVNNNLQLQLYPGHSLNNPKSVSTYRNQYTKLYKFSSCWENLNYLFMALSSILLFFFKKIYLFSLERKRASTQVGEGQKARERENLQADSLLSMEPDTGLHLMTLRSRTRHSTTWTTQVPWFCPVVTSNTFFKTS